jgi:hypothetical protein
MEKIVAFIFIGFLVVVQGCGSDDPKGCPEANCSHYSTQQEAQADYDSDPACREALDTDHDHVACEDLPSDVSGGCPTTSNCGCSGKNKDECGGACCKWVVGSGCKCK